MKWRCTKLCLGTDMMIPSQQGLTVLNTSEIEQRNGKQRPTNTTVESVFRRFSSNENVKHTAQIINVI